MNLNLTNRRTLVESLDKDYRLAVEVGVRTGWFSKYILDNTNMHVTAIDPWEDNKELSQAKKVFDECTERLKPYGDRCEMLAAYSPACADQFEDESLDFVYIDALHDYDSVKADMEAWLPKLKYGGVLAGHDYSLQDWPGIYTAVEEFSEEQGLFALITGTVGNARESQTGDLDEYDGDQSSWAFIKE